MHQRIIVSTNALTSYARRIVRPRSVVGSLHRCAAARHLADLDRVGKPGFPFVFDAARADAALHFFSQLTHYKGEWAGQRWTLEPWQVYILGSIYGWIDPDTGARRFRSVYVELPRKSGKSFLAAGVLLYTTFFDGEMGAEGYSCGVKRDQSRIVFDTCKAQVQADPHLKQRIQCFVGNLNRADTRSKIEPLSADYNSMDGLNPACAIVDEYHAHKTRGVIDVLETAQGARRQPLLFVITTAGTDLQSPCFGTREYVRQVVEGVISDDRLLGFVAHADQGDDPFTLRTWKKANPMFGITVNPEDMKRLARQAKGLPSALASFRTKRLNQWVEGSDPWLNMTTWRGQQSHGDPPSAVTADRRCFVGVDLSSKIDLTACVVAFEPTESDPRWRLVSKFWTPTENLEEREHAARAPFRDWIRRGHLERIPGARIDVSLIRDYILAAIQRFQVDLVGIDPWNDGGLLSALQADLGVDRVVEVGQTVKVMSEPSKIFEAELLSGRTDGGGHPVLTWMLSNAVVIEDAKGNIFPSKRRARGHIDGVIATIICFALARTRQDDDHADTQTRSVYEDRDLVVL